MPVGSSRYPTARNVMTTIRAMLDDNTLAAFPVLIISAQRAAGVVTITTQGPHGLIGGLTPDQTVISSVPVGANTFNGTFYVATVVSATQFTYVQAGANETQLGGFSSGVGLGAVFTDPVLLPYVNSAYRKVRRSLSMAGMELFVNDLIYIVIPAVTTVDPSVQVVLSDSTSPQLPVDLLEPNDIWERTNLTNDDFIEMTDLTGQWGLPSLPQGSTLGVWEWRTDQINFLGATLDTQIRLRYKRVLLDVVDGTSQILIPDAQDCITFIAAAEAGMARGSSVSEKWATAGEDGLEALISATTRRDQSTIRRRKPNSSRTGGYWSGQGMPWGSSWLWLLGLLPALSWIAKAIA